MQDLEGKVAFITGGGSGVALGQAKVFAEEAQMKVVIADLRKDHLDEAMDYFSRKNVAVHPIQASDPQIATASTPCSARSHAYVAGS